MQHSKQIRRHQLTLAFDLLKSDLGEGRYGVTKQTWQQLIAHMDAERSAVEATLLMYVLDRNGDDVLGLLLFTTLFTNVKSNSNFIRKILK